MTTNQPAMQTDTLEVINSELAARAARDIDAGTQLDTKVTLVIGYAAAAASFFATRKSEPVLAVLAYIAYGVSAAFGISAFILRDYHDATNPRHLFVGYAQREKQEVLAALAATRVQTIEYNAGMHKGKARRWGYALGSLILGVLLMIAAIAAHSPNTNNAKGGGQHAAAAWTARSRPEHTGIHEH